MLQFQIQICDHEQDKMDTEDKLPNGSNENSNGNKVSVSLSVLKGNETESKSWCMAYLSRAEAKVHKTKQNKATSTYL